MCSSDLVEIRPGAPVRVEVGSGAPALRGAVRRVEPSGFTKVSALGVEEQRVNVIVDIVSPRGEWPSLGDGFRVDARIVVYAIDDAIKVPTGALFRDGQRWAVFAAESGVARKRLVELQRRGQREAAVASGLAPGVAVIMYPSDAIADGVRVEPR